MATKTRIHVVEDEGEAMALVRARSRARAIRHCIANRFGAHIASQDDLIRMLGEGMKVETADAEPEAA
jgi:hypothetical protein